MRSAFRVMTANSVEQIKLNLAWEKLETQTKSNQDMERRRLTLVQFIEQLDRLAKFHFPLQETKGFLIHSILLTGSLEPYLFLAPDKYTRNLIHKSSEYELLVIGWSRGQRAPIHGHEGEKCWTRVERGFLRFTQYCEIASDRGFSLKMLSQKDGGPGFLDGPADIHQVANISNEIAVTLHLYSRPFDACDIYDSATGYKLRKRLEYYSKFGKRNVPA
jgi:NitT/TauT family transport system ATP-binding protein